MIDKVSSKLSKVAEAAQGIAEQKKEKGTVSKFEKVRTGKLDQKQQVAPSSKVDPTDKTNRIPAEQVRLLRKELGEKLAQVEKGQEAGIFKKDLESSQNKVRQLRDSIPQVKKSTEARTLQKRLQGLESQYFQIDQLVNQLSKKENVEFQELLKLQIEMQALTQKIEIFSKAVEQVVGGIKTIIQTNV